MQLHSLVIFLFLSTAALVESLREVSVYVGDTVILPSGADSSWRLSEIQWSIFSNNTWIATYRKGKESIDRFYQYKGRLQLNISTGDLIIQNLTTHDAMEYCVDLISTEGHVSSHKIKLIVREHLQKPTVQTVYMSIKGDCRVMLHCSSTDEGVAITWQIEPPSVNVSHVSRDGSSAVILASFSAAWTHVEFTCSSSRNTENASSVVTLKCNDEKPGPQPPPQPSPQPSPQPQPQPTPQPRTNYYPVFLVGVFVGGLLSAILICCCGEKLKAAWKYLKEKLLSSRYSSESSSTPI